MLTAFTSTSRVIAFSTSRHASTGPILTLSLSSLRLFPSLPHWLELGPPSRGGSRERAVATHSNSFSLLASHAWDSIDGLDNVDCPGSIERERDLSRPRASSRRAHSAPCAPPRFALRIGHHVLHLVVALCATLGRPRIAMDTYIYIRIFLFPPPSSRLSPASSIVPSTSSLRFFHPSHPLSPFP
ncbi:hypothetical protein C2E23DRAFT_766936 [Lenzites betulinus]|nr:hypothetical protein C2E23DRAFT_766936 [Lenzites betulinus]